MQCWQSSYGCLLWLNPQNSETSQSCSLQQGLTTATVLSEVKLLLPSPWLQLLLCVGLATATHFEILQHSLMHSQGASESTSCSVHLPWEHSPFRGTSCGTDVTTATGTMRCACSGMGFLTATDTWAVLLPQGLVHCHCPFGLGSHCSSSLPRAQEHGHCCYQNVPRPSSQMISSTAKGIY